MNHPNDLFHKLGMLALIGFGAVFLSGPLLAVASVILSLAGVVLAFALVGFLIWAPIRLMLVGQRVAADNMRELGRDAIDLAGRLGRLAVRVISAPPRLFARVAALGLGAAAFVLATMWSGVRFVAGVAPAVVTGVLAGIAVGIAGASQAGGLEASVPLNAVAGGLIGAGVGTYLTVRERRGSVRRVSVVG